MTGVKQKCPAVCSGCGILGEGDHRLFGFQDERWYDLIVILDDATSEIYYAQPVEDESSLTVIGGLKEGCHRCAAACPATDAVLSVPCY